MNRTPTPQIQRKPKKKPSTQPRKRSWKKTRSSTNLGKESSSHHIPTLGPRNRRLITNRKRNQTARTRIRAMPFTMLHMFPRLQSLDRLEVIQTWNKINSHRPITELPREIRRGRRRKTKIGRRRGQINHRRWGFRRRSERWVRTNERVEGRGIGEEEDEKAEDKYWESEHEWDFSFLEVILEWNRHWWRIERKNWIREKKVRYRDDDDESEESRRTRQLFIGFEMSL